MHRATFVMMKNGLSNSALWVKMIREMSSVRRATRQSCIVLWRFCLSCRVWVWFGFEVGIVVDVRYFECMILGVWVRKWKAWLGLIRLEAAFASSLMRSTSEKREANYCSSTFETPMLAFADR